MVSFLKIGREGRFGNQIAQICGTISTAVRNSHPFAFPEWKNYDSLERFGSKEDIDVQKYFSHPLPPLPQGLQFTSIGYAFGYHEINLPKGGNWDITHHFQSPKYFDPCIDLLRYYMTMKEEGPLTDYVGLHVRLGDYSGNNASYHPRQTMEYYEKAMAHFDSNTKFLVFSDEMNTARQMFGNQVDYAEGNSYLVDFRIMKRCKHFIIGNSSFSWCASLLSEYPEKKIIAPSNWFGPAFGSSYRDMSKDIYPAGAIVI